MPLVKFVKGTARNNISLSLKRVSLDTDSALTSCAKKVQTESTNTILNYPKKIVSYHKNNLKICCYVFSLEEKFIRKRN